MDMLKQYISFSAVMKGALDTNNSLVSFIAHAVPLKTTDE
jgi:hypothetical protein